MKLQQLVDRYIAYRQALGDGFRTNASFLRAFARAIGARATVEDVRREQVDAFLAGTGPITSTWFLKHTALLGFYRYAISRKYVATAPLPVVFPKRPPAFVPYIYTHDEIRRLLQTAEAFRSRCTRFEPLTARTMLLLMYATGLRVHEAMSLNRTDVDLDDSVLTVRHTKFEKSRLVPFGSQLRDVLIEYLANRPAGGGSAEDKRPFFSTRAGTRITRGALAKRFTRIREMAGIHREGGARNQPRMHDLRHTFAVHRLTSWYRQGADVQTLLPQLSVYLGHVYLSSTQVYLTMTPELLQQAGARFDAYASSEGGSR